MLTRGDAVDRYVIEAVIGEGGMGRVYRALDPRLGRRVALKVLGGRLKEARAGEGAARLLREARAAAAFSHPNVVAIHDVGEFQGSPYIAMELVHGHTLGEFAAPGAATTARKVSWLLDLARGLAAAHRAGLVHRDIKPDNVMVTPEGIVKILDFGIARRADADVDAVDGHAPTAADSLSNITKEGHMVGTPQYMSPEQLKGEPLDGRCDEFAWGVVAWELIGGRGPWGPTTNGAMLVTAVLFTAARPLVEVAPDVPPAFAAAVARALSKDREKRFRTMDELLGALEVRDTSPLDPGQSPFATTQQDPTPSPIASRAPPNEAPRAASLNEARPARSKGLVVAVAAVLGVALVASGAVLGLRVLGADRPAPVGPAITEDAAIETKEAPPPTGARDVEAPALPAPPVEAPSARPPSPAVSGMVTIPAGKFAMGTNDGAASERPVHEVRVAAFRMDATEVTAGQYSRCVDAGACAPAATTIEWRGITPERRASASALCNGSRADRALHPINCVDASMADSYCKWAGERLPTEEEWEYAARGPEGRTYPWGEEPPDTTRTNGCSEECVALRRFFGEDSAPLAKGSDGWEGTAPVGSFPAGRTREGLYDMAGNVWEWTSSMSSLDYGKPRTESLRVYRGGSWHSNEVPHMRGFHRSKLAPTEHPYFVGFRCAK